MTDIILRTARVVGTPSQTFWSQVYRLDTFFLVVVLKRANEGDRELNSLGKQFLIKAQEAAASIPNKDLASLRALAEKLVSDEQTSLIDTLIIGLFVDNVLYCALLNGEIWLTRSQINQPILTSPDTFAFASGFIAKGDILLFLTPQAKTLALSQKPQIASLDNQEEIAELLSSGLPKVEIPQAFAAFIVCVENPVFDAGGDTQQPRLSDAKEPAKDVRLRVGITIFFMLLLLLILSLVLGTNKRREDEEKTRFNKLYTEALKRYDEGIALSDLNPTLAGKILKEGKDIVQTQLPTFADKTGERKKLDELTNQFSHALSLALRIEIVESAPLFFDLTLIKDGATGSSMSSFGDSILILDSKEHQLLTLTIAQKRVQLLSALLPTAYHEALGADSAFILGDEGIWKITLKDKKRDRALEIDDEWGQIKSVVSFASNLYLLDAGKGSIYKYQSGGSSFGQRRNYLSPDVTPDFSTATSLAIDGSIWVLFADGRIAKYTQGVPQSFAVSGLDMPLSDPRVIFTDDENKNLYILDSGNTRVVVVKKDGTYDSQYRWEGIKETTDMVVSEKEKKILLLSGSKIFAIEIK